MVIQKDHFEMRVGFIQRCNVELCDAVYWVLCDAVTSNYATLHMVICDPVGLNYATLHMVICDTVESNYATLHMVLNA